ncbi:MAG: hypothetical protein KYX62_01095 [Pseudomonadota bacterium]|nr:hypothetical protein [Pseudomonadota bacterium]
MKKAKGAAVKAPKARNLHACAAIMRKGGAHQRSEKASRNAGKRQLQKAMREGGNSSPFLCLSAA